MSIVSNDLKVYLSGGTGNTNINDSLGGARSTVNDGVQVSNTLNNMWPDITSTESSDGSIRYRCVYIRNTNVEFTWSNAKIWISTPTESSDDEVDIAIGSAAINATEQTIANDTTAPSSVTFSRPTSKGTGLNLGTLTAGQHRSIWIRRTVDPGAAQQSNNFYILAFEGETPS